MKKFLPIVFAVPLFLATCSGGEDSLPASSSSLSTTSSTPSSSSTPTTSELAPLQAPPVEPAPTEQPLVTKQPSTGSIWAPVGTGYQCPGTDAFVYDPANCTSANLGGNPIYDSMFPGGQDLSNVPYANGGTCPAYKCGYGSDANGNPNPSSGEIQTIYGCKEGYITDSSLCDTVSAKAEQYGW